MSDDSRSDANLRQFASRSKQSKRLATHETESATPCVNVFVAYEQPWASVADEMEATRFRYVGASPQISMHNQQINKRTVMSSLSSFKS